MRKLKIGDTITYVVPSLNTGRDAIVLAVDTLNGAPLVFANILTVYCEGEATIKLNHVAPLHHNNYIIEGEEEE